MTIWIILTLMCCLVCVALTIPLVRKYEGLKEASRHAVEAYRIQIAEVEKERAAKVLNDAEAEAATIELKRRMIDASEVKDQSKPLSDRVRLMIVPATALAVAVASTVIYAKLGSPSLVSNTAATELAAVNPAAPAQTNLAPVDELTKKLRQRLEVNPVDAEGWRMLGWSHFNMQDYAAAVEAFGKALALQPANLDFKASLAEAMVQAEQGTVSPQAKQLFDEVMKSDPLNERARFYLALALEQKGADTEALQAWQSLLKDAPTDAAWLQDARSHVEALGQKAGVDVSASLQANPAAQPDAVAPAISKDDMAAVQALSPDDQQAMIRGMVEKLASRLQANPDDAQGWAKLLRARMVMNDPAAAQAALQSAFKAFPPGRAGRAEIEAAARNLAIPVN